MFCIGGAKPCAAIRYQVGICDCRRGVRRTPARHLLMTAAPGLPVLNCPPAQMRIDLRRPLMRVHMRTKLLSTARFYINDMGHLQACEGPHQQDNRSRHPLIYSVCYFSGNRSQVHIIQALIRVVVTHNLQVTFFAKGIHLTQIQPVSTVSACVMIKLLRKSIFCARSDPLRSCICDMEDGSPETKLFQSMVPESEMSEREGLHQ